MRKGGGKQAATQRLCITARKCAKCVEMCWLLILYAATVYLYIYEFLRFFCVLLTLSGHSIKLNVDPFILLVTTFSCRHKRLCVPDPPLLSFVSIEPAAAERQFHGGAGGGSQEAATCLPLYRSAALRQAEETDWRVKKKKLFLQRRH